jgi:type II secretory pathway component PulM
MNATHAGERPRLRAQDRRALLLGAAALLLLLGYSAFIRPALQQLAADRHSVESERALLDRERSLLGAAPLLPRMARETKSVLAAESPRLFAGDSVAATAALTAFIAQSANSTGVRLTSVDARPPRTQLGIVSLSVDVRGEGSWPEVLAFLRAAETSGRLIDVTNLRLERGARGGDIGTLVSLSATLVGYARRVP